MSLEERVQRFVTDAQRPPDAKTAKDIAKLRTFLYKHQAHRFTDSEQQRLFTAVQRYTNHPSSSELALGLVEDALKMPFTVFTTSMKKSMLKWLDKLDGQQQAAAADGGSSAAAAPAALRWTVLDVTAEAAEVMDRDGETREVQLSACDPELVAQLRRLFGGEDGSEEEAVVDEVVVELGTRQGAPAITRLVVPQQ